MLRVRRRARTLILDVRSRAAPIIDSARATSGARRHLVENPHSETTANASGSGFLGFGAKVSPEERKFLEQLRTSLSIDG